MATPAPADRAGIVAGVGGATLVASALVADGIAAWFFLTDGAVEGALVHLHAALCWTLGLALLLPPPRPAPRPGRRAARRRAPGRVAATGDEAALVLLPGLDGRLIAAGVVALALFPLAGMVGWGLAWALTPLLHRRGPAIDEDGEDDEDEGDEGATAAAPTAPALVPLIEPLADRLRDPDPEERRAAVAALGRAGGPGAVRLLRRLLDDADPDLRGDASVMLAHIEDRLQRRVEAGRARAEDGPGDAAAHAALAAAYADFADSGLLDGASARHARAAAAASLARAGALDPDEVGHWLALARLRRALGDAAGALDALHEVALREPGDPERVLLNMAIAFDRRDWPELAALARGGAGRGGAAGGEAGALIPWWAGDDAARPA